MSDDIIVLETAAQRIDAILSGRPGVILIDSSRMRSDESVDAYPLQANYLRESATSFIANNATVIHRAAAQNGISEDLLKAVIYLETSHSVQDVLRSTWINETLTPANVNAHIWGRLLGYTELDTLDPAKNIELAARVLSELQARIVGPTPAAIATLYNSTSQDLLNAYGMEVAIYMEDKPWLKGLKNIPMFPDITGFPIDVARCFPAHTRIQTSRTTSNAISALRVGDVVLAFDARADKGRGALVPRRVTRLYRNTTTDWIRLRWVDGTAREVITTPGHHFLDALGGFLTTPEMTRTGSATVVLASGALTPVTAERTPFCADVAPLFERAMGQGGGVGKAAVKVGERDGWGSGVVEGEGLRGYAELGLLGRGRHGGTGRVHLRTVWKFTELSGFVTFRSPIVRGNVGWA